MAVKVRGKVVTTTKANEEILKDNDKTTIESIKNVSVENKGTASMNVIFNGGDKILIEAGETLALGDILIESMVVVEIGSVVRYLGIN